MYIQEKREKKQKSDNKGMWRKHDLSLKHLQFTQHRSNYALSKVDGFVAIGCISKDQSEKPDKTTLKHHRKR